VTEDQERDVQGKGRPCADRSSAELEREEGYRSAPVVSLEPYQERQIRVRFVKVLAESYDEQSHFSQVAAKLIAALKEPLDPD
jgi:hypothetical protein